MTPLPPEFHVETHEHEELFGFEVPNDVVPLVLLGLICFPIIWYILKKKKEMVVT